MNGNQPLWMIAALAALAAVILLLVRTLRYGAKRSTSAAATAWLVATMTSGTILVTTAAQVIDIIPRVTAIDIGVLAVMGVLTGLFLGFALMPALNRPQR